MKTTTIIAANKIKDAILTSHINTDNHLRDKYINIINEKFDVPTGNTMDYIAGRNSLENASLFGMYVLSYGFDQLCGTKLVDELFTKAEVKQLSKQKYSMDAIQFPIDIECLQVAPDQWIGKCDVDFLMKLRDGGLINYNINAQRTMQRVVKYGVESYKIAINRNALKAIRESFGSGQFIPNTITLNIPDDEFDWKYEENKARLRIYKIKHLDIADGYHRYLAMCQLRDENKKFNYPVELRIIHFPDSKVKQFIYQEDQKTKRRSSTNGTRSIEYLP